MKKILYLASGAVLALASCSDDFAPQGSQNVVDEGNYPITAQFYFGAGEDQDETRTTLNSSYQYLWNFGDQIGVLGAVSQLNVINAPFANSLTGQSLNGNFIGNVNIMADEGYFAYYPWTATDNLDPQYKNEELTEFTLSISEFQNFNTSAAANSTWNANRATGSFGPNSAPAYAVAYASDNDKISFSFNPVASYLSFPITSTVNANINKVVLSISGGSDGQNQVLVRDYTVSIDNGTVNTADSGWGTSASTGLTDATGQTITLLCSGNGVAVGPNVTENFWFVVPSGITLAGNSVSLEITATIDGKQQTFTRTRAVGASFNAGNNGTTKVNDVIWLWQATGLPFTLSVGEEYYINTPAQFLEYAYLVTHGLGQTVSDWKGLKNYSLTDLPNMLKARPGQEYDGNLAGVTNLANLTIKQAVISGTLDVSPTAIAKYLQTNSLTNIAKQSGYYTNVYANYVYNNIPLPTIGSGNGFTLGGLATSPAVLTGLVSAGPIFDGVTEAATANIQYLTLTNCTAGKQASGFSPFLSTPLYTTFTGVVVGTGCSVGDQTAAASNVGVFKEVANEDVGTYTKKTNTYNGGWGVSNGTAGNPVFDLMAGTLYINTPTLGSGANETFAFNFTALNGGAVENYGSIEVQSGKVPGAAVMAVADEEEAILLMDTYDSTTTTNGKVSYSVVDLDEKYNPSTSYWTGFTAQGATLKISTAEYLAYKLQNAGQTDAEFDMNVNLNLMGSYMNSLGKPAGKAWYAYGVNADNKITVNAGETWSETPANSVENVYINGLDARGLQKQSKVMTVFGYTSIIPELVYISDVTIDVKVPGALVAGVSVVPGDESNVSVNNLTVNIASSVTGVNNNPAVGQAGVYSGVGGLYQNLNNTTLAYVGSDCSYLNGNMNLNGKASAGVVAGVLNLTLGNGQPDALQMTIPYVGPSQAFGKVNVAVNPNDNSSSFLNIIYAGKSTDNWKTWNYVPQTGVKNGYSFYVLNNGTQYLQQASTSNGNVVFSNSWSTVDPAKSPVGGYTSIN